MSDVQDALAFYRFLANAETDGTERLTLCVVPGPPISKARARYGKRNVYSSAAQVAAERRTAAFVQQALRGHRYLGNVALGCIFYRPNHQRVDADNMLKHVCDAINGLAFADDSQVTAIAARVELDKDTPRTVIILGPHQSSLARGANDETPCSQCGTPVSTVGRRGREVRRYCSVGCKNAARRIDLSEPVPCKQCQQPFRRTTTAQQLCSPECRAANLRAKRKSAGRTVSNCATCGKKLAHNRGGRCRECWRAAPKAVEQAAVLA